MRQIAITIIDAGRAAALPRRPRARAGLPERIRAVVSDRVGTCARRATSRDAKNRPIARPRRSRSAPTASCRSSNISGDIMVTRGTAAATRRSRSSRPRARATADEASELLGLVTVSVNERSGRAEVKTRVSARRRDAPEQPPQRQRLGRPIPSPRRPEHGSRSTRCPASIRVSDIKGDVSANSISGTVHVANGGRISAAKSVSGDVEIVDTQTDGAIDVQSISGGVTLRKVSARRIDVGSVSGSVTIQDAQCDRVEAHSVSGNVEFGGTLAKGGRYELNSHSGDVRVVALRRDRLRTGGELVQRHHPLGFASEDARRCRPPSIRARRVW